MSETDGHGAARAEILFVAQATTASQLRAAFPPADDELAPAGLELCRRSRLQPGRHEVLSAPARSCLQTVAALGWHVPRVVRELGEPASGVWEGRQLASLTAEELTRWRSGEAPPGGESLADACARVRGFIRTVPGGRYVAVVAQPIARAALLAALELPASRIWDVDVEPLATVGVSRRADGTVRLRLVAAGA